MSDYSKFWSGDYVKNWEGSENQKMAKLVLEEIPVCAYLPISHTIIDIPIGTGRYLACQGQRFTLYIGVDLSLEMLAQARTMESRFPHLALIRADAEHPPFRESCADVVLCVALIRHLPEAKGRLVVGALRSLRARRVFAFTVTLSDNIEPRILRNGDYTIIDHAYTGEILPNGAITVPINDTDPLPGQRYLVMVKP